MSRESCIKVLQDVFERDMACVGITLTHEALEAVIEYLKDVPSADVQPVVRCRDCKYWEETLNGKGYCKDIIGFGRWWKGNDYCSYGEQEDR